MAKKKTSNKKTCVVCGDCDYNLMKQLTKLNQLLWNIDGYISDAKKAKHKECQKVLERLRDDTQKNAERLKQILIKKCCEGKL